jgi:Right handed beta helix region
MRPLGTRHTRPMLARGAFYVGLAAIGLAGALAGCTGSSTQVQSSPTGSSSGRQSTSAPSGSAPASGTAVCNTALLDAPWNYSGPAGTFTASSAPKGLPTFGSAGTDFPQATKLLVVPAGDNTQAATAGDYQLNDAVVYFAPGEHKIESTMFAGHDSAYVGGYTATLGKAVIDGVDGATDGTGKEGGSFEVANASSGNNVYDTWEYLTVKNYASSINSSLMGNVNGSGNAAAGNDIGDTYKYMTIGPNEYGVTSDTTAPSQGQNSAGGYAIDAGSNTTVEHNCLTQNAQGAFNVIQAEKLVISGNEISKNGLGLYPDSDGSGGATSACGCSGGGKVFFSKNAVFTGNYVHDNYNDGVWFDTNNGGADISGNYFASNWGAAIGYEASYNANISDNTLVGNGWASNGAWPAGVNGGTCGGDPGVSCTNGLGPVTGKSGDNPYAAIDLSNSGGNSSLATDYSGELLVEGNVLTNNFGGVKIYTDTNRYPGNLNGDSACSLPLGVLNQTNSPTYYKQGKILVANGDADVSGKQVTVSGGTQTICGAYGQVTDDGTQTAKHAPEAGMAVYDQDSGAFLGIVASVASSEAFTLDRSVSQPLTAANLLLSGYGGCGPADDFNGALNQKSGKPAAEYFNNCIWGSTNVTVKGNTFKTDTGVVQGCTEPDNLCGYMEDAAFNAGVPKLMQFFDSYTNYIAAAKDGLGNVWSDNTYEWTGNSTGWLFMAGTQGNQVSRFTWQQAPYAQDAGSSFSG